MAETRLHGPSPLTYEGIDRAVEGIGPGVYALGRIDDDYVFRIARIGRSDDDLKSRLYDHVGQYPVFKHGFCGSAREAFNEECRLFHDFPGLPDNERHPDAPNGTSYKCPICGWRY